jgi:predicted NBD/HSP70 family sugar kinase
MRYLFLFNLFLLLAVPNPSVSTSHMEGRRPHSIGIAASLHVNCSGLQQICGIYCAAGNKRSSVAESRIIEGGPRGVATDELRRHNLGAVLERLHLSDSMTRSELAVETGLNRSTIRDLLNELSLLGVITEEKGTPSPGPGRPSSVAAVRPEGAVVLAVELEVDSVAVATVGLGGRIMAESRKSNLGEKSPEQVVERLAALAGPLLECLPPTSTVIGVAVAVAGVVRRSDGFVHVAPNLGWENVPIANLISSGLDLDLVRVANEADLGALGEFRRGAGADSRHMIYVTGEVGVGIGIIHEAAPMLGVAGYAGEAGHMVINPSGSVCRCGATGCWETEVGEEALIRRAGLDPTTESTPIESIMARADDRDVGTLSALEDVGRWLGVGLGNLINILNPDTVVLGGFYQRLYPHLAGAIEAGVAGVALDASWEACRVVSSDLGANAILIGAAELVFGEVISDPISLLGPVEPAAV